MTMALREALHIPPDALWVLFWIPLSAVACILIGKLYGMRK
jgi:hypothetical protein